MLSFPSSEVYCFEARAPIEYGMSTGRSMPSKKISESSNQQNGLGDIPSSNIETLAEQARFHLKLELPDKFMIKENQMLVIFFSFTDGSYRAIVTHFSGHDLDSIFKKFADWRQHKQKNQLFIRWLKLDWVVHQKSATWSELHQILEATKRNYFRYGIAFDDKLNTAFLEQELNSNAMLYLGSGIDNSGVNEKNFMKYGIARYGRKFVLPTDKNHKVVLFSTQGIIVQPGGKYWLIHGYCGGSEGKNSGRRIINKLDKHHVLELIHRSSSYLAHQVHESGRFTYGFHPCFDREIKTYNSLRHASTTYSMLEAWEITRDSKLESSIKRSISYLVTELICEHQLESGTKVAFLHDIEDEIKLGGNAVSLLALVKYTQLTKDNQYLDLLTRLALGIEFMQDKKTGQFVHVLNSADLTVKNKFRIIYYDGEAAFGLMRLYGMSQDVRWLDIVEKSFEYFIDKQYWKIHDHWLGYCINELTIYRPLAKYYEFGIKNFESHLDFVINRITTYPTLLELMMASHKMIVRLRSDNKHRHLLKKVNLDKFNAALNARAHYLLNGYFWPELAIYFQNPSKILGSFFIRHHAFRVRIDDVEHYLSGYVAYFLYYLGEAINNYSPESLPISAATRTGEPSNRLDVATIAFGGDVNIGRRQHYRTAELGLTGPLGQVKALQEADVSIANLECVCSTKGQYGINKNESGPYYYRARPEMINLLVASHIHVVATANNHSGDYGPHALIDQQHWLRKSGILHVGTGEDREKAFSPTYFRIKNLNIALFAVDSTMPSFAATEITAGTAFLPLSSSDQWHDELFRRIQRARKEAHLVLILVHWEWPPTEFPSVNKVKIGHALIDAGADAVLGSSGHKLHGIEIYRGRPIIYDAGDLLFDAIRSTSGDSGLFHLEVTVNGIERIRFYPIKTFFGFSKQLHGEDAQFPVLEYADKCKLLDTNMSWHPDGFGLVDILAPFRPPHSAKPSQLIRPKYITYSPEYVHDLYALDCLPPDFISTNINLGPLILLGFRTTPSNIIDRRQLVWVYTCWSITRQDGQDYRIQSRLVPNSSQSHIWGKSSDHDPCDWQLPTRHWKPGLIYHDTYPIRPPASRDILDCFLHLEISVILDGRVVSRTSLANYLTVQLPPRQFRPASAPCLTPLINSNTATQLFDSHLRGNNLSIFFLVHKISNTNSGIENSSLMRARLFEKEFGLCPAFLISQYNPFFSGEKRCLADKGRISLDLSFFNVFDYYQGISEETKEAEALPFIGPDWLVHTVPNTEDHRVYDSCMNLIMYIKRHPSTTRIEYINHFSQGHKWRRDTYDSRGFLSRIQLLSPNFGIIEYEYYLRPSGSIALIFKYRQQGDKAILSVINHLGSDGHCIAIFNDMTEFIENWLFMVGKNSSSVKYFILDRCETFLNATINLRSRLNNIIVIPFLHNTHTVDGFSADSGKVKNYAARVFANVLKCDAVVLLTHSQKSDIESRFGQDKYHVIPHAVLEPLDPLPHFSARSRLNIVYIARYVSDKNQASAIKAFALVLRKCPAAKFYLYGNGAEKVKLLQLVNELSLAHAVFVLDFASDPNSIYSSSGLSISTSLREGFSLAILESMASGCPVVAYDVNYGPSDMISDGVNGILVPFGDENALAESICSILENPGKHQAMSAHASESIRRRFDQQIIAYKWRKLLEATLFRNAQSSGSS